MPRDQSRDILHIPSRVAGTIITCENTVLLDYNCEGFLFRALEELNALSAAHPHGLEEEVARAILGKYGCDQWIRRRSVQE